MQDVKDILPKLNPFNFCSKEGSVFGKQGNNTYEYKNVNNSVQCPDISLTTNLCGKRSIFRGSMGSK